MAPSAITDDYYAILEVTQTATLSEIVKSYRRLALTVHPDRNSSHNATATFQLLNEAHETLKDESRRRSYDLLYPQIQKGKSGARPPQPSKVEEEEERKTNAEIATLLQSKKERLEQWCKTSTLHEGSIFEMRRDVRRLQSIIQGYENKEKADLAEQASANSWSTWIFSPIFGKAVVTEEVKQEKARDRVVRVHAKWFKEQELAKRESELKDREAVLGKLRAQFEAANSRDDAATYILEGRLRAKRERERLAKEVLARQRAEEVMRQYVEKMAREAAEAQRTWAAQLAREAAERKRREEAEEAALLAAIRKATRDNQNSSFFSSTKATCSHTGWWPKSQGWSSCEECSKHYSWLLQCPHCAMKACGKCQRQLRISGGQRRTRSYMYDDDDGCYDSFF